MNERTGTLKNKHWLLTGPAETHLLHKIYKIARAIYYTFWTLQCLRYCRVLP